MRTSWFAQNVRIYAFSAFSSRLQSFHHWSGLAPICLRSRQDDLTAHAQHSPAHVKMLSRPKEWKRSICAFACSCFITHVYVTTLIVAMARCISDVGHSVLNVAATCINEPMGVFRHEQPLSAMWSSDAVVSGWFGWRNCKVVIFAGSVQCCNKLDARRQEGLKENMVYCRTWKRNTKCEQVTSYLLLARQHESSGAYLRTPKCNSRGKYCYLHCLTE